MSPVSLILTESSCIFKDYTSEYIMIGVGNIQLLTGIMIMEKFEDARIFRFPEAVDGDIPISIAKTRIRPINVTKSMDCIVGSQGQIMGMLQNQEIP